MIETEFFTLKITPRIEDLWEELGMSESDQDEEVRELVQHMVNRYNSYTDGLTQRCLETREEIKRIQEQHRKAMVAYGNIAEEEMVFPTIQSTNLIHQLEEAQDSYNQFQVLISERTEKLKNLVFIAGQLFDELGITERGEFSEMGDTDFSRERLERFRKKIDALQKQKEQRIKEIAQLKGSITQLLNEVVESTDVLKSDSLTEQYVHELEAKKAELENLKEERIKQLSEYAVRITHLWDMLGVPTSQRNKFLKRHSTLGNDVMESCAEETKRLCALRDEKLPELIVKQRNELESLWEQLHTAQESRKRFEDTNIPEDSIESVQSLEFKFLEEETLRLKTLAVQWHPILEAIQNREEIIRQYEEMQAATSDPNRLTSRSHGSAQQLMKEERARRRYKQTLPMIEKKLLKLLNDYKKKHNIDFEWDGVPYREKLVSEKPKSGFSTLQPTINKRITVSKRENYAQV